MVRILLILSISILYANSIFSAEHDKEEEFLKNPKSEFCVSQYTPEFDEGKYVQMGGYMYIQPEFIERVLSRSSSSETLEICAGYGNVLKDLLKKQGQNPNFPPIRYTAVESCQGNMKKIQKIYQDSPKKEGNWLGCSIKNIEEFLTTNLHKKQNKYDQIFAGFALHVFPNNELAAIVNGLFNVLKEDGLLYITQHSFAGSQYDPEYIENVKQGKLMPFWVKGQFWSDPYTMGNLLNAFGFEIVKSGLYEEIHLQNKTTTKYLGIIAQKQTRLYNKEMVGQYREAANLSFVEVNCLDNITIRLSSETPGDRFLSIHDRKLWSIQDPKVPDSAYNALKVYTCDIGADALLLESLEVHPGNRWLVRSMNAFLSQVANDSSQYKTIFAIVNKYVSGEKDGIPGKLLKQEFSFEESELLSEIKIPQGMIGLKAVVSNVRESLR